MSEIEIGGREPVGIKKFTALMVGENNGLIGPFGSDFKGSPEHYRRITVYTHPAPAVAVNEPVAYQCREHGDTEWHDCSKESFVVNPGRYVYRALYARQTEANDLKHDLEQHVRSANKQAQEIVDLTKLNEHMIGELKHIAEYWNRDQNEGAMANALWHIIRVAEAAIAQAEAAKGGV